MQRLTGICLASAMTASLLLTPVSTAVAGSASSGSGIAAAAMSSADAQQEALADLKLEDMVEVGLELHTIYAIFAAALASASSFTLPPMFISEDQFYNLMFGGVASTPG